MRKAVKLLAEAVEELEKTRPEVSPNIRLRLIAVSGRVRELIRLLEEWDDS